MDEARTITRLLDRWRQGDDKAFDELLPLEYEELRQLAARHRRGGETLRPTALVHEAYMHLKGHEGHFENRIHFFAAAATTMPSAHRSRARQGAPQARRGSRPGRAGRGAPSSWLAPQASPFAIRPVVALNPVNRLIRERVQV
jgi:hypothetical protein